MEDRGKLHADDTGTNDAKALGEGVETKETRGIDHTGVVGARDGEPFGLRASGNDDVSGCDTATYSTTDGMGGEEGSLLADKGDIGMREKGLYPTPQLRNDLRHALLRLSKGGGMDVGLRGNTAHVQAGASHPVGLEKNDLQSCLGGKLCGTIASGTCTDDDEVRQVP
jgi:hypothetical protein